jgi:hypothetical protein
LSLFKSFFSTLIIVKDNEGQSFAIRTTFMSKESETCNNSGSDRAGVGEWGGCRGSASAEAIAYFKRRRLKAGHCINHCRVLANIPADVGLQAFMNLPDTDRFRLCQGPMVVTHADRPYLHCWIESARW